MRFQVISEGSKDLKTRVRMRAQTPVLGELLDAVAIDADDRILTRLRGPLGRKC